MIKETQTEQFTKHDQGKIMPSLVEPSFILGVASVATYGAKKYDVDNWKKCSEIRRYKDAFLRHWLAYQNGEFIDGESGMYHLDHAAWNLMALRYFELGDKVVPDVECVIGEPIQDINCETIKDIKKAILKAETDSMMMTAGCFQASVCEPTKQYSIEKHSPDEIKLNGVVMKIPNNIKKAGTDYFIYEDKLLQHYYISDTKTDDILIGGFHYGLIPEDFKAINNIEDDEAKAIAGINEHSIYHRFHRPIADPRGLVYSKKTNSWCDIYMTDHMYNTFGYSRSEGHFLAGVEDKGRKLPLEYSDFKYKDFEELAKKHNKRMMRKKEFQIFMDGVKENDSAGDECDGTIHFTQDFTSKYGIIQATGHEWVWSSDKYDDNSAVILGGARGHGTSAGSRASHWNLYVWNSSWDIGCRFACDHMTPEQMSESEFE